MPPHSLPSLLVVLVNFIIAGAQKCGTTAVFNALSLHPDIGVSVPKEVHFFDNDALFSHPPVDYDQYHRHFRPDDCSRLRGEATPAYLYWQPCPARIKAYNPAIKLILILRNPVERAYSHWNMLTHKGRETLPFGEALRAEPARLRQADTGQSKPYSYMDRGFYACQLERYLSLFAREQILVLPYEELVADFGQVYRTLCDFLGLRAIDPPTCNTAYALPYTVPLDITNRQFLLEVFRDDITRLERLLGWDCSHWLAVK